MTTLAEIYQNVKEEKEKIERINTNTTNFSRIEQKDIILVFNKRAAQLLL